ncbi:MAG: DUF2255 family protein [Nocardioides sp.]|uniref:DUF2255 family protein n=1 Tax=Nocardioides sp. TaxID=35761 RepID=UPI0039E7008E
MTNPGPAWPREALDVFSSAEEIEVGTRRHDGTLRGLVPIWVVALGGTLYVRSYRGTGGAWYRHATADPLGVVRVGGRQVDVVFSPSGSRQRDAIDAAYRAKYARYRDTYLPAMLAEQAVATTLRLDPASGTGI